MSSIFAGFAARAADLTSFDPAAPFSPAPAASDLPPPSPTATSRVTHLDVAADHIDLTGRKLGTFITPLAPGSPNNATKNTVDPADAVASPPSPRTGASRRPGLAP